MYVLGINYLSESSVCLFKDNKLIYAISEERLNRKKNWYGIPLKSIDKTLKDNKLKIKQIDFFATHGLSAINLDTPNINFFEKKILSVKYSNLKKEKKNYIIKELNERRKHETLVIKKRTRTIIEKIKKKFKNIYIYDHHTAHAASAYYFSGFKSCYVLTIDGWGDNASAKLFKANDGNLKEIKRTETIDSLGYFYGSITKLLGFTPHKHEGKVLGLAAYASPKIAIKEINKIFRYNIKTKNFEGLVQNGIYLPKFNNKLLNFLKKKYSKSEIASAVQYKLEKVVTKYISDIESDSFDLALAGGVFSNVKLNQKIQELKKIKNIFIFPNMGDGGLSVGAAALCLNKIKKYKYFKFDNMYLGPSYKKIRPNSKYKIKKINISSKKLNNFIANQLSKKKIFALHQGRMEFGPRALCNRSIICGAENSNINITLNKKLKRTEFMPFAPVVLAEDFDKYFFNLEKKIVNTRFMTITYNCKKKLIDCAPAVVHVDNTARPQLITKKDNKRVYNILSEYKKITGNGVLINTSFNMHEEPIVCSVEDSYRAFAYSKLDYLIIDDEVFTLEK